MLEQTLARWNRRLHIYAVEVSSSRSGRSVSRPVAIDVIGLGYPLDRMEDSRSPFSRRVAARRLDLVSVKRIQLALHAA